jgi:hypothetical protein
MRSIGSFPILLTVTASLFGGPAACGGGGGGQAPGWAAQADLAGTWDAVSVVTNGVPNWFDQTRVIDANGQQSFLAARNSSGSYTPPTLDVRMLVDAKGVVTAAGADANLTFRGQLATAKTLIVASATNGTTPNQGYNLAVFRKRVSGATFQAADLANLSFTTHSITTGSAPSWRHGTGTTDGSGTLTVTSCVEPTGACSPPPAGSDAFLVDPVGLVTKVNDPTFRGYLDQDKKKLFAVSTDGPGSYRFTVLLVTGQAFTQADLAARFGFSALESGPGSATSSWIRGDVTYDAAGVTSFSDVTRPGGPVSPPAFTVALDAGGAVTRADDATYSGQVAWGKDLMVRTLSGPSRSSLSVLVR